MWIKIVKQQTNMSYDAEASSFVGNYYHSL